MNRIQSLKAVYAEIVDHVLNSSGVGPVFQVAEGRDGEASEYGRHDGEDVHEHGDRTLQGMVLVLISKRLRPALYLW